MFNFFKSVIKWVLITGVILVVIVTLGIVGILNTLF